MRLANFLLALLPLAGHVTSSQQRSQSEQNGPVTGVDPAELVAILTGLTSLSRSMRLDILHIDKHTAAQTTMNLTADIGIQSYILATYAQHLKDMTSVDRPRDRVTLIMSFLKWKTHTRKFLVVVGQSYETFRQADPHLSTIIAKDLALFEEASAAFYRKFQLAIAEFNGTISAIEPRISGAVTSLPDAFYAIIRIFTQDKLPTWKLEFSPLDFI